MGHLKTGDKISCRLKDGVIVGAYEAYDETKTFAIVAIGDYGYYLYVPYYYLVKNTIVMDRYCLKRMDIDPRFLGENMVHITESMVNQVVQRLDGLFCSICQTFCQYAVANLEDDTFTCFSCRQNPYH